MARSVSLAIMIAVTLLAMHSDMSMHVHAALPLIDDFSDAQGLIYVFPVGSTSSATQAGSMLGGERYTYIEAMTGGTQATAEVTTWGAYDALPGVDAFRGYTLNPSTTLFRVTYDGVANAGLGNLDLSAYNAFDIDMSSTHAATVTVTVCSSVGTECSHASSNVAGLGDGVLQVVSVTSFAVASGAGVSWNSVNEITFEINHSAETDNFYTYVNTFSVASPPPPPVCNPLAQAINCGSGATVVAKDGYTYIGNQDYKKYDSGAGIDGTADDAIYNSEAWNAGDMSYDFSVDSGKVYLVTLRFAEIWFDTDSQRMFNVAIEGTSVAVNLDVHAAAGGKNKAYNIYHRLTTADTTLTVTLSSGAANNPKIAAILVQEVVTPLHAVNCGGDAFNAAFGDNLLWETDNYYLNGNWATHEGDAITGTADEWLYQTERWMAGSLEYELPVTSGTEYEITMKFAEVYNGITGPNQRVFDVSVEGVTVVDDLDLWAEVGPDAAYDVVYRYTAADNVLNIQAVSTVENPKIGAIKVVEVPC